MKGENKMKKNNMKIFVFVLVLLVVGGAGVFYMLSPKEYETVQVIKSDLQEIVSETGSMEGQRKKTYYADRNMTIQEIAFEVGHTVKEDKEVVLYTEQNGTESSEDRTISIDFTGVVTESFIEEGAMIAQGSPLFTVEDNINMCAVIELSSDNLKNVEKGQKANITCGDNIYQGSVSDIKELAVKTTGKPKIAVEVSLDKSAGNLYIGSEVEVDIFAVAKDSVMVAPIESVYSDVDYDYVYLIENGIIVRKPVRTGISSDKYTEIEEGLSTGDMVIVSEVSESQRGQKAVSK